MASKRQTAVKNKIQSVIGKYNHIVSSKPPFSNSELVVMAVLCLSAKKNVARKHDIYQWIIKNIKYYRDSALKEFARAAADETSPQYENVVEGLNDVFCSYEVPLSGVSDQTGPVHSNMDDFTIPENEGRVFLRNVLCRSPKGRFRFLDLPPEIRLRIYEMTFSFPEIEIGPIDDGEAEHYRRLFLYKREHDGEFAPNYDYHFCPISRPLQKTLALLSVNKQVFNEAVPYFYRINRFRINNMRNLVTWVQNIAPSRLEHVRHIAFQYFPNPAKWLGELKNTFTVLALHNAIKTIRIETYDDDWFHRTVTVKSKIDGVPDRTKPKYAGPGSLPHMSQLAKLVSIVDELTIEGDSPRIEEHLRAQMKK